MEVTRNLHLQILFSRFGENLVIQIIKIFIMILLYFCMFSLYLNDFMQLVELLTVCPASS